MYRVKSTPLHRAISRDTASPTSRTTRTEPSNSPILTSPSRRPSAMQAAELGDSTGLQPLGDVEITARVPPGAVRRGEEAVLPQSRGHGVVAPLLRVALVAKVGHQPEILVQDGQPALEVHDEKVVALLVERGSQAQVSLHDAQVRALQRVNLQAVVPAVSHHQHRGSVALVHP